jgi:hypothetical protein
MIGPSFTAVLVAGAGWVAGWPAAFVVAVACFCWNIAQIVGDS